MFFADMIRSIALSKLSWSISVSYTHLSSQRGLLPPPLPRRRVPPLLQALPPAPASPQQGQDVYKRQGLERVLPNELDLDVVEGLFNGLLLSAGYIDPYEQ